MQAQWVDLLGELEALKNAVTATQARLAVALDEATRAGEARQGVRAERRGRGVPNQVGAAMGSSPHAGSSFLGAARVWVTQMPYTFAALRTGVLSSYRATLLVRETSHLSSEHRVWIDREVCGPTGLSRVVGLGTRRLVAWVKDLAARLDVHACVERNARAVSERGVWVRPAPDLMVYLTALVPMVQGVQAYAQLKAHAEMVKAGGDERGAGQIMADTLVERVTGRGPGAADEVPVTINLLVSDQTLFTGDQPSNDQPSNAQPADDPSGDQCGDVAGSNVPGVVLEGMAVGAGVVPAPVARHLVANGIDAGAAWLRSIYVDPRGRLLATSSTSRFYPAGLAGVLRAREQGICATVWCDAAVRHLDHVIPHGEGGETSLGNGQGLCARCNHAKQAPGWRQKATRVEGRHAVETVTPTGHTYVTVAPCPPEPARTAAPVHAAAPDHAGAQDDAGAPATAPTGHTPGTVMPTGSDPEAPGLVAPEAASPAATPPAATPPAPAPTGTQPITRRPAPGWTPAVGITPPPPGRTPRSRYSIACHTTPRTAAIAYRPPGRRRRTRHQRRTHPDLTWAHTR